MRVKVLGCSGAIAKDARTTSFLVDHDVLIDAGTGVGDLTLTDMSRIDAVFLTHSHLDHIVSLPLMLDAIGASRTTPLRVYALLETITALKTHIFNNIIWPDFSVIPNADAPYVSFHVVEVGRVYAVSGKHIEVLPAAHCVPAVGYAVTELASEPIDTTPKNDPKTWVFSGDTEHIAEFWQRINQLNVGMLVIETTFSAQGKLEAIGSMHLSADVLLHELANIHPKHDFPIYITHSKPNQLAAIQQEVAYAVQIARSSRGDASEFAFANRIKWLQTGDVFEV